MTDFTKCKRTIPSPKGFDEIGKTVTSNNQKTHRFADRDYALKLKTNFLDDNSLPLNGGLGGVSGILAETVLHR